MKLRKKILFGLLFIVIGVAAYNFYEVRNYHKQLAGDADRLVKDMAADIPIGRDGTPLQDVVSSIVASREYGLFGQPIGKITVFVRISETTYENGKSLNDGRYAGVGYQYELKEKGWVNTESGLLLESECKVNGEIAFRAAGI